MKNEPVEVSVTWNPANASNPISGRYSTIAKFDQDLEDWPNIAWSVLLDLVEQSEKSGKAVRAKAQFIVPGAPWGRLVKDCRFELYEGNKIKATVTVL